MPNDKENLTVENIVDVIDVGLDLLDGVSSVGDVLSGLGEIIGGILS